MNGVFLAARGVPYNKVLPEAVCYCLQRCNFVCPFNKVLPEGICCCLQTCNFDVVCMLMNNVCVQSCNFL